MHDKSPLQHVVLGVVTGAHGVRGTIKIKSYTEFSDNLTAYGPLYTNDGDLLDIKIKGHHKDMLLADITGVTSRESAQAMRGTELMVPRSALPDVDTAATEYYIEDLINMSVMLEDSTTYGTVKSVQNYGAGDIIEITIPDSDKTVLLPFTDVYFPAIDYERNSLTVTLPEYIT